MTTIRACCGTPDDARYPSPHARDCRYAGPPARPSGGPFPLRRDPVDDMGIAYATMTQAEYAAARHAALYPDRDA